MTGWNSGFDAVFEPLPVTIQLRALRGSSCLRVWRGLHRARGKQDLARREPLGPRKSTSLTARARASFQGDPSPGDLDPPWSRRFGVRLAAREMNDARALMGPVGVRWTRASSSTHQRLVRRPSVAQRRENSFVSHRERLGGWPDKPQRQASPAGADRPRHRETGPSL